MKKFSFILTVASFVSLVAAAQINGKVDGRVSSTGKPVEAATISLLKASDSSLVKMTTSSKAGDFVIEKLPEGKYLVAISSVGMNKRYSPVFELNQQYQHHSLPATELTAANKALKDVVVSAKRPLIEQKPGKTLVNVDASPTNGGLNALELLEKSPGVSVDKDGNISLRGKAGVMILIDGKQTYLSGADLPAFLKNLQSNNLDQIEIMTNPPARYDAAGNAGIINIKTKKSIIRGMNGSLSSSYTQGFYGRTNNSLNLNYRNNKLNLFGGYGMNRYEGFNDLKINRRFYASDNKTVVGSSDQVSRPHFAGFNHNTKLGLDYTFSKKDVAGFVINTNFSNGMEDPISKSFVRNPQGGVLYSLETMNDNTYKFSNISGNFNYKHTFDSTGKEITADVDYVSFRKNSNTLMSTQAYDGNGYKNGTAVRLRGEIPSRINVYSAKFDYTHPLSKTAKLEAGLKGSFVNTNNQVEYNRDNGSGWKFDDRSNHFIYKENILAGYITFSKNWKKWNMQAGLRGENTIANGTQLSNDSTFKRNYFNLFPNVGIGYELNNKHQFNLSYSRRVDRPDYDALNPFVFFLDSLTYGKGNPYLQPQFTNKVELSHTFNRFLTTSINYSQTDNVITNLLKQDTEKKITYQTSDNVNMMRQLGLTVMINTPVTKWWNTNIYMNVFNNHYTGVYQADPIDIQFTAFMSNITNSFVFGKGWGGEISGFYRSRTSEGLLIARGFHAVNAGISKQILKNKGSIKLSVRDIFFSQRFNGYARYSDVDVDLSSIRDSRQVSATFVYRFGKSNIAPARKRSGGAGEEQSRIRSGN